MTDPQLYKGRELRRRMLHLDPEVRRRVDRAVRRGERARSPEEARLVVSVARANLGTLRLLTALLLALAALRIVWFLSSMFHVLDVVILALVAVALAKFWLWDRPRLRRAERLNRQALGGT